MTQNLNLIVVTYPSVKVYDGTVDDNMTVKDFIKHVKTKSKGLVSTEGVLIVDRNQQFHRIPEDDPVNRYYNGQMGQLYRIIDGSSTRYRYVTGPIASKEKKVKTKEKVVSAPVYALAYETLLTMLKDRGCDPDIVDKYSISKSQMINRFDDIANIILPGQGSNHLLMNKRGKAVYVRFIDPGEDIMTSRRSADLNTMILNFIHDATAHYNRFAEAPLEPVSSVTDDPNPNLAKFHQHIEIIVIYNNANGGTEIIPGLQYKILQQFTVQSLSFNVTKHVDQPQYVLLDSDNHSTEIRDMYAINGRTLDPDERLSSYNLRQGTRLMLL